MYIYIYITSSNTPSMETSWVLLELACFFDFNKVYLPTYLSNWKEEACKISGLQRVSNPWPPRYQYDARPTELVSPTLTMGSSSYLPVQWNDVKYIWNSHMYCGCRWMWRVIIAVNSVLLSVLKQTITLSLSLTLSPTFAHKIILRSLKSLLISPICYFSWGRLY